MIRMFLIVLKSNCNKNKSVFSQCFAINHLIELFKIDSFKTDP